MKSKNQYLFSIIMPIYNVDKWLDEAINSIINQRDINFEKDVQLILVNDCSPDSSEDICKKYQNIYKNNVLYVKNKQNMGLSATRNHGLEYATGKYINFFDPDDVLSPNTLAEIRNFFHNLKEPVAHVSIPLVFFEAASGLHPKYKILGNKNRIIDLTSEGESFILSSASSFYPKEIIKGKTFDTSLFGEEDTLFNFNIYQKINKFGYVCENNVCYHYRKRATGNSQVDQSSIKPKAFHTPINLIKKVNIDRTSTLFYELVIYELRSRLKTLRKELFDTPEEYHFILNEYRQILSQVPTNFVMKHTKFLESQEDKIAFLTQIYNHPLSLNEKNIISLGNEELLKINDLPINIKEMRIEKNTFVIEVLFNHYNLFDLSPVLFSEEKEIIKPIEQYYCDSEYIKKSGGVKSSRDILYARFEIPVFKTGKYKFYFKNQRNGYIYVVTKMQTYSESPFLGNGVFNSNLFKIYSEMGTSISLFNKQIRIDKSTKVVKTLNRIKAFFKIKKEHNKFKWLRLLKKNKPQYWLFNDRPINANDNAEYFFEYINKHHKKLAKNCYFILAKNSPDLERMKKIGNVVIHNSFKHKYLYLNAKYIFTSHLATSFFKPISFKFLKYYNDLIESKIIWLQHGITMNNIETGANRFNKHVDKIVTAASFESSIFMQKNFFYRESDIWSVGFPRYDKLQKRKSKTILIMPTWRSYLSGAIQANGLHAEKAGFTDSEYFKCYRDVLTNESLLRKAKELGYNIKFVLHPGFKQYAKYFMEFGNDVVTIMDKVSFSYNKLFNQSCLLVTDYSSVFFDFAYTRKPTLFFQFDSDDFFGKHYKKGLFNFESMAPGKIITQSNELSTEIIDLMKKDMKVTNLYNQRISDTFLYFDSNNCERLLAEVMKND